MKVFKPKKTAYVRCDLKNCTDPKQTCSYGCIRCEKCVAVCKKDAIFLEKEGAAKIDPAKCVGCGLCVKACPQNIISIRTADLPFVVLCSNKEKGKAAKDACDRSCIACGICVKNCPSDAIHLIDQCAVIDEAKCLSCGFCMVKCPRNVIKDCRDILVKKI